jgi:hypothetical protein
MTVPEILEALEAYTGRFPMEAVRDCNDSSSVL